MKEVRKMGIADLRPVLGERVDAAYFQDEPTVITKNDKPRAAIVPYAWYEQMLAERELGDEKPAAPGGPYSAISTGLRLSE